MKYITWILIFGMVFSVNTLSYCGEVDDDSAADDSGTKALGGALMGGLLGAGLGAAIGSASGRAGAGAAIGAGVGAVGGTLLAANEEKKAKAAAYEYEEEAPPAAPKTQAPKDMKVKKRVIRQYDAEGNVISEKEVKN